jgi:hypothetical protein
LRGREHEYTTPADCIFVLLCRRFALLTVVICVSGIRGWRKPIAEFDSVHATIVGLTKLKIILFFLSASPSHEIGGFHTIKRMFVALC